MQVLFVDVGQGSCQVILLGDRRAIVIDSGSEPSTLLRLLRVLRIETIELLVVSHSHTDHSGGAARIRARSKSGIAGVLADYAASTASIAYVFDSELRHRAFGRYLVKLLRDGVLTKDQLVSIDSSTGPQELWTSDDGNTLVAAISPLAGDTLLSWETRNPNATSAVIELRHKGEKIVFTADSTIDQWRDIYRLRGDSKLHCKVMSVPHHGGAMGERSGDLDWFLDEAVGAEVAVVSVGTINRHGHPREDVVRAFSTRGVHVMCTQITNGCSSDLESLRPGVVGPVQYPCLSSSLKQVTRSGRSRNVACAGSIAVNLNEAGIEVERAAEHRVGVDQLVSSGNQPFCRCLNA